jgi:hypothetical protein
MGTSVSHGSPRGSSNWRRVFVCYGDNNLPTNRIINEIWRASENQPYPISSQLKSNIIFSCYDVVKSSSDFREAINKFDSKIFESKSNSIIAEFAKRVIPVAFQSSNPSNQWAKSFFSEITNYIISRDASGFVGKQYRNKTVNDLIDYKKSISTRVDTLLSSERAKISSQNDWNSFVDKAIANLKSK